MYGLQLRYIAVIFGIRSLVTTSTFIGLVTLGLAQNGDERSDNDAQSDVAATVDNVPILVAEVHLRVRQALGERTATDQARALLQAEALEQLIDQQKVLVQLQQRGEACTQKESEVELHRLEEDLNRQEKSMDDYCRSLDLPLSSVRRMLQWQLSWKRCCEKYLTDENVQRHFERHRKEFDGTTMRVAQLLLKPDPKSDRRRLMQRVQKIRSEIVAGKITFADAAHTYSQSPSGRQGGQLGWISRRAPMPEPFSKAAYQLDVGDVSQPVETAHGMHLIHCLEIKPGQKNWQDVRSSLENAVSEYLFRWLADRPEPKQVVQYTGKAPYFRPGTRELAERVRE